MDILEDIAIGGDDILSRELQMASDIGSDQWRKTLEVATASFMVGEVPPVLQVCGKSDEIRIIFQSFPARVLGLCLSYRLSTPG